MKKKQKLKLEFLPPLTYKPSAIIWGINTARHLDVQVPTAYSTQSNKDLFPNNILIRRTQAETARIHVTIGITWISTFGI